MIPVVNSIRAANRAANALAKAGRVLDEKNFPAAIASYTIALGERLGHRDRAFALGKRGWAYTKIERDAEAIRDFSSALQIEPNLLFARLDRALAIIAREDSRMRWLITIRPSRWIQTPSTPTRAPAPSTSLPGLAIQHPLLNISTRLNVGTGDNVLIGGFIVVGTDPKRVLLRAIGPSLTDLGVPDALADPVIELHYPDMSVVTNDNWRDTQEQEIMDTNLFPTDDFESAIIATLDPGPYTAIVSGKNNTTGIGLVEVYDLDEAADSELANISTRGFVDTGDNVMIGGFIVGDGINTTVVVRAIGPSLGEIGISNPLQDPTLELHGTMEICSPPTTIGKRRNRPRSKPPAWSRPTIASLPSYRSSPPACTPRSCAAKTTRPALA